jgi:hypothetical protein
MVSARYRCTVDEVMDSYTKVNEAEVVSTSGYKVKYGRESLTYSERDRYVLIPIEHLGEPYEMAIYLDGASRWSVRGKEVADISAQEKELLAKRISESLQFLGRRFSIQ